MRKLLFILYLQFILGCNNSVDIESDIDSRISKHFFPNAFCVLMPVIRWEAWLKNVIFIFISTAITPSDRLFIMVMSSLLVSKVEVEDFFISNS